MSSYSFKVFGSGLTAALVGMVVTVVPTPAWACGGCFSPPSGSPSTIKQTGERILFAADPVHNKTRVWIEIRYNGPANKFAWVLPLPKVPKVGIGDSWVFDRLDLATMPQFEVSDGADENCEVWALAAQSRVGAQVGRAETTAKAKPPRQESELANGDTGCGGGFASSGGAYTVSGSQQLTDDSRRRRDAVEVPAGARKGRGKQGSLGASGKVHIAVHDQIGPYDYVVVDSKDPAALTQWLTTEGYAVPKAAGALVADHVAKGDVFLAVRLSNPKGAQEIKPIALEMDGAEACVPLRLTSLAAVEDTQVVVYLAGPGRALPKNTPHVVVNPAKLAWFTGAGNYPQVLSTAMDEAGGHAFATEFSGSTAELQVANSQRLALREASYGPHQGLFQPGAALSKPQTAQAQFKAVANLLQLAEVLIGVQFSLTAESAAVLEQLVKLADYLQRTDTLAVYQELLSGQLMLNKPLSDFAVPGESLGKALTPWYAQSKHDLQAIQAMRDAILAQPKLTRLVLAISPAEMDRDPLFTFDATKPDVDNRHFVTAQAACTDGWYPENAARLSLPGLGSWLYDYKPGTPPATPLDPRFAQAPAALVVEVLDETGPTTLVATDQVDLVDSALAGAVPGKASLPAGLTLKVAKPWQPPPSDAQLTAKLKGAGLATPRSGAAGWVMLLWLAALVIWSRGMRREAIVRVASSRRPMDHR